MASVLLARGARRIPRPPYRICSRRAITSSATPTGAPLRTGLYTAAFTISAGLAAVYYLDARAAVHRYVLSPVLRNAFDAETGHRIAVRVLGSGLGPRDPVADDDILRTELWGQELRNPVGLAAGFDKDGEAVDGLFNLGFSWVEVGSVTPKPQPGNPKPRLFRLPDDNAVINRYGFNSQGHAAVLARLRARTPTTAEASAAGASLRPGALLAVNLGKNKDAPAESVEDFVNGVRTFAPYADVLVVNVSSPNTPGLRGLQTRRLLEELLAGVTHARDEVGVAAAGTRRPKLVLKIAPDLSESELIDVAAAIKNSAVDGVIVSNTTLARPASLVDPRKSESGGLSGAPLKPLALAALRTLRAHLPASVPLIGCGGIATGRDALEFARAGAAVVQVYTAFGYDGVGACRRIKDELAGELRAQGTTWGEVVKKAVEQGSERADKGSVEQLVREAEHLRDLLDALSAKGAQ